MRKYKLLIVACMLMVLMAGVSSCRKNFGEINTNPNLVTVPDIGFLLTYSEDNMVKYQYNEWIWEGMEQLLRFTQHISTDPYEMTGNVNSRYGTFYASVLPNLREIRKQIALKEDKEAYQKMGAVTYILEALHGLKVTDMNGSIPFLQAMQGRDSANFSPAYDSQQALLNTFLQELDNSISVLSGTSGTQNSYGSADVFYKSDWTKWIMLANSIKLRIATRLDRVDNAKTREIFQQVMQDAAGSIVTDDAQLSYQNKDYLPFGIGGEINYRSARFGSISFINFLKKTNDPRLPIYFDPNGLQPGFKDTLKKYSTGLPSFIDTADALVQFQGGPADFTVNPTIAGYIKNAYPVGNTSAGNSITQYFLISGVNKKFFSPRLNNVGEALYKDVMVTAAESALIIAEFVQKGYGGTIDTKGTAEDWYKKGIASSIRTMNGIAVVAESVTAFSGNGDAAVATYLADPDVAFNGTNDLERIYIQEHLNFYRNPNEAFVFSRRTGYPKNGSAYYGREVFNEPIPRRFWTLDPGEVNRDNWEAAMTEQGFTPNAQDVPTLSSQRIWYDKTAPEFGQGE